MKAVFLLVAVAAVTASAVRVSEAVSRDHKLAKIVSQSRTGQSLLLEITQKLQAGAPIDELENIIEQITTRITDAQEADDIQHGQRQENCTIDQNFYRSEIKKAQENIVATKEAIIQREADYDRHKANIATLSAEINTLSDAIQELFDQIEEGRKLRAAQKAEFINISTDTTSVIAAVEEIRGLEVGSTLKNAFPDANMTHVAAIKAANDARDAHEDGMMNDGDRAREASENAEHAATVANTAATTTNIETERFGENIGFQDAEDRYAAFAQLDQLAKKTQDPQTRSYLQVAATAARALSDDDVARLLKLLDELLEELRQYTDELIAGEKTKALDWANEEASLTGMMRSKQATRRVKQDQLETQYADKKRAAQDIHNLREALDGFKADLKANEQLLADSIAECNLLRNEHAARKSDRDDEIETLEAITRIVSQKLKEGYQNNDVATRVSGVTVQ